MAVVGAQAVQLWADTTVQPCRTSSYGQFAERCHVDRLVENNNISSKQWQEQADETVALYL